MIRIAAIMTHSIRIKSTKSYHKLHGILIVPHTPGGGGNQSSKLVEFTIRVPQTRVLRADKQGAVVWTGGYFNPEPVIRAVCGPPDDRDPGFIRMLRDLGFYACRALALT